VDIGSGADTKGINHVGTAAAAAAAAAAAVGGGVVAVVLVAIFTELLSK